MLYQAYEAHNRMLWPMRTLAHSALDLLANPAPPLAAVQLAYPDNDAQRRMNAAFELIARARLTHKRPPFGIESVESGGRTLAVTEEVVTSTPFADLLRFRKDVDVAQPRVLLVAPMSGHFATLMRDTVRTLLAEHDVYVTDWHNARDIPVYQGRFGFDEYVAHLMMFLDSIGPGAHLVAVCQPCVAALAAAAVMAEGDHPARPRSLTLMAGPIDCRVNPTKVNELATAQSDRLVRKPPDRLGAVALSGGVAPGVSGLPATHRVHEHESRAPRQGVRRSVQRAGGGRIRQSGRHAHVLREYFAVADLPAEFYLKPSSWCSRTTRSRAARSSGKAGVSIPARSARPRC